MFVEDFRENKKFNLKKYNDFYMKKRKNELSELFFEVMKKEKHQIDDVLVVGLKI